MSEDTVISMIASITSTPVGWLYIMVLNDRWRFSDRAMKFVTLFYFVVLIGMDIIYFANNGVTVETKSAVSILNIISAFLVYQLLSVRLDGSTLFVFFSACIFIFISDTISDFFVPVSVIWHLLLKMTSLLAFLVLIYCFFRNPFRAVMGEISRYWLMIAMLPFSICLNFAFLIMVPGPLYMNPGYRIPSLLLCMVSLFSYIGLYMVFHFMDQQGQMRENYTRLQSQTQLIKDHAMRLERLDEQMRMYRHDMRHFVNLQAACLEQGDLESAKKALHLMGDTLVDTEAYRLIKDYTGIMLLDTVLSFYENQAVSMGVEVKVRMEAPPLESDEEGFCVMLSNSMENAVHACRDFQERRPGRDAFLTVTGRNDKGKYYLEIINSCDGDVVFDERHQPVGMAPGHGWGNRSITAFVKKHGGMVQYHAEGERFIMRIIL